MSGVSLDVHVLTLPGLPDEWIEQRRESLAAAVAQAGYPVAVHEIEGIDGHLGRSRAIGYAAGTYPYVTHVDHDDYVAPDAFAVLREQMEAGVDCITTGETWVFDDGRPDYDRPQIDHHLAVFRRGAIAGIDFASFRLFPDQFLLSHFRPVHIRGTVYKHRIWDGSASRGARGKYAADAAEELSRVRDNKLFLAEALSAAGVAAAITEEMGDG